ncbi:unnamed protein product [Adineta steineri]|uniref:Uncharacterized protein n=1 Tax=Adineta steineri TaxID=433720 RepID=A0A819BMS1_9BILA|nr:unnamed protein product [Adineta steineri]
MGSGPACCTNEIFNSYALSLSNDLKILFDDKLSQLPKLLSESNRKIGIWTKEYLKESHRLTILSLETLFGEIEYHTNIHHTLTTLFNILGNHQSTGDDVSKSTINLFNQLILSSYRRFMTYDNEIIFDEHLKKCLITTAFSIEALPTQRELLYTLTSAASLLDILRTLFIYIAADIQRLQTTATLNSHQCLQRYVRETLCPICVNMSSTSMSSIHYDNNINEPLCENDCHYVIKTCFDQTNNPYVTFAVVAQGYSNVIKQIQESVIELKLVERLSKLHIYLYDMVINATNNRLTYTQLQNTCSNPKEKPYSPILSLPPIISERRELVTKWNESLHSMLNQLQTSINNLNSTLMQHIITNICSNSNYAVKSNRCTQIDQHTPGDFSQWPLPISELQTQITSNINNESTQNQLADLKKRMIPIQDIIMSLKPKRKYGLMDYVPEFEYDDNTDIDDNDTESRSPSIETYENDEDEPLSEQIYKAIDEQISHQTTEIPDDQNINHSSLLTYKIELYLFVFVIMIVDKISLT